MGSTTAPNATGLQRAKATNSAQEHQFGSNSTPSETVCRQWSGDVLRSVARSNQKQISMLALGVDSAAKDPSYWAYGLEELVPHPAND